MTPLGQRLNSPALRYSARRAGGAAPRVAWPVERGGRATASDAATVSRRTRLEAVLLLAREPLPLGRLAQLANLADATEARTLLTELGGVYAERGSAFQIEAIAGGYQLLTRPALAPWVEATAPEREGPRLSGPAMETLAVVAYRQPVLRAEVEAIRGVQCGELLRQLMERDLLRIVGRSKELGRPILYGTTKRFLRVFGLRSLEDLPRADELRAPAPGAAGNDPGARRDPAPIPHAEN